MQTPQSTLGQVGKISTNNQELEKRGLKRRMGCVSSSSSSKEDMNTKSPINSSLPSHGIESHKQSLATDPGQIGNANGHDHILMDIDPSGSTLGHAMNDYDDEIESVVEIVPDEPLPEKRLELAKRIRTIPFFSMHSFRQIKQIARNMEEVVFPAGTTIFTLNSDEDAFFTLQNPADAGKLITIDSPEAKPVRNSAVFFGETCLRYNGIQRRFTLIAEEEVAMYQILPVTYRNVIIQQAKQQEYQFMHFLRRVPILGELTDEQLQALGRSLQHARFSDGTKIITQGSHGSTFYFVESGVVRCLQRTQKGSNEVVTEVNRYSAGDYFGEGALLQDAPRNADVIAVGEVTCLTLTRNDFNDLLGGIQQLLEHNFRARVLKGVDLFKGLTESERRELADLLVEQVYDPSEQIIQQGDVGDHFYIIKEGEVRFTRNPSVSLDPDSAEDNCHAESELLEKASSSSPFTFESANGSNTAAAAAAAALAAAAAATSPQSLPQIPPPIPSPNTNGAQNPSTYMATSSSLYGQPGSAGDNQTEASPSGMMDEGRNHADTDEEEIGRLFTGQYFGEGALLTDAPRRASAYAVGNVTLLTLERNTFASVFNQTLQDMLNRNFEKRKKENDDAIEFTDLEQIKVLGAGSYGQVLLVTNKVTGKTYALKTMSKQRIVAMDQQRHILNEKAILESTNHPFIVSLKQSYISTEYVFVLLEAVLGGELFAYMRAAGRIKLKDALFYIAQVVLVFEYLHSKNIIYRDLKPENLLVAANGYLKFTDFGLSKILHNERKTYTLCGTPSYAPPEVYNLSGHGKAADWWTLGVLTHELLSATTPFNGTPEEIFSSLEYYSRCYPNIKLPKGLSGPVGDFTLRLLNPNPSKRLGCLPRGAGVRDVKMHTIFMGFAWNKLLQEQLKAPFKPKIRSMYDTDNFYPPVVKGKPVQLANVDPSFVRIAGDWTF